MFYPQAGTKVMDSATACMKYVIFMFNFVLFVMGGAILGVSVWVRSDSDFWEYHRGIDIPQYYQACYVGITLGLFLLIISFLGCCGAATESTCMLFTYFLVMIILLVLEIATAGLVWKHGDGDKFQEFLTNSIKQQINLRSENSDSARFVDLLQLHMECCGGYDKDDYHMDDIPQSCSSDRTNNIYFHGCGENLRRYLEQKAGLIGGIALGIVLMQIIALMFTACLFATLREDIKAYR